MLATNDAESTIGSRPSTPFLLVGFFAFGVSFSLLNSHWQSLIQTKVGFALQGRVISANQLLVWAMMPIGYFLTGIMIDHVLSPLVDAGGVFEGWLGSGGGRGIGLMFVIIGSLEIIWGLIGWQAKRLRQMGDTLPDAIPSAVIVSDRSQLQQLADEQLQHATN